MTDKVTLVDLAGATSIHIEAEITSQGDLLFSGHDLGQAPLEVWGDSDYEYWLKIRAPDKDQALLALIEKLYAGNAALISALKGYLESRGIPCEFQSYA